MELVKFLWRSGGPRVVISTAAFHARVRGSVPGLGGLKETKMFLPHPRVKVSISGSLHDREVACSASDRQGSNFESCVWRTVSSLSSHHPQEVLLAQFSLYVHKGGLKPDSFHFIFSEDCDIFVIYRGFKISWDGALMYGSSPNPMFGLKKTKMFLPRPSTSKDSVLWRALDSQGSNCKACASRAVSSDSYQHLHEVFGTV